MDYYDAQDYANSVGRKAGIGSTALLLVGLISYNAGIPPAYAWLACGLVGLLIYELTSIAVLGWSVGRETNRQNITIQQPEIEFVLPEAPEPEPLRTAAEKAPQWVNAVDWPGLLVYLSQANPVLSREAVAPWVDQRIYSPRDEGTTSFPALMVALGAARVVGTNGGQRYIWTDNAPMLLGKLRRQLARESPSPIVGSNGTVNNRQ